MRIRGLISSKGFVAVEAIITIVLVAAVGISASQLLLKTTQRATSLLQSQRAVSLANMVFTQYASYAASNFTSLSLYQPVNVTPKAFFYTADNMGYNNMTISAVVRYSQSKSTCTVDLSISWPQGGQTQTSHFSKNYSVAMTVLGGGIAQVYVKLPCGSYSTQADIIANCPGIPGVLVSGKSVKGDYSQGITDANGSVILNQLATLNQNQFTFKAPSPSDFNVPVTAPNFVPLYYGQDSFGNYITSLNATEPIASGITNTVFFTAFQKAGSLTGHLIDDSSTATSLAGSTITLQNVYAPVGDSLGMSQTNYSVFSAADGSYSLANIILTNASIFSDNGLAGSAFNVQYGQPGFQWAYYPAVSTCSISAASYTIVQGIPTLTQDTHLKQAGSITFHTVNKFDTTIAIPNVSVTGIFPPGPGYDSQVYTFTTDSGGNSITLYNVLPSVPATISVTATANTGGYAGTGSRAEIQLPYTSPNSLGGATTTTNIPMSPLYHLTGTLADANPAAGPALYSQMTIFWKENAGTVDYTSPQTPAPVDGTGSFIIDGLYLDNLFTNVPHVYWTSLYMNAIFNPPFMADFVGTAIDQQTGQPARHASLSLGNLAPTFYADNSGHFDSGPIPVNWYTYWGGWITCRDDLMTCSPTDGPLSMDSTVTTSSIVGGNDVPTLGYHIVAPGWVSVVVSRNSPTPPINVNFTLQEYQINGIVTDAVSGARVPNITVNDPNSGFTTTTGPDGSYTLWSSVQNRTSTANGSVSIQIMLNQLSSNGFNYSGASISLPVPSAANPSIPIPQNFPLNPTLGSSV